MSCFNSCAMLEKNGISVQLELLATEHRNKISVNCSRGGSENEVCRKRHANILQFCGDMLNLGVRAQVFCSSIQSLFRSEFFCNWRRVNGPFSNDVPAGSVEKKIFEFEKNTILYLRELCNISQPSIWTLHYVNSNAQAIDILLVGLETYYHLQRRGYYKP